MFSVRFGEQSVEFGDIHVEEGKYYIGVVRKVSEEDHDLRVRTVDEVPESKHVQKEQQVNE